MRDGLADDRAISLMACAANNCSQRKLGIVPVRGQDHKHSRQNGGASSRARLLSLLEIGERTRLAFSNGCFGRC